MKTKLLLTLIIALYSLSLSAQIITDRPDQTESSSTVPSGALQIESGVVLTYNGDNFSDREILAPTTLFRYGLNKNFELRLVSQFESLKNGIQSNSGISDLEIGTKVQIYQKEGSNTEIAFLTHLLVPSGSKELTLDNYASINKISIAHDLSENASFGYNIGYDYFGEGNGEGRPPRASWGDTRGRSGEAPADSLDYNFVIYNGLCMFEVDSALHAWSEVEQKQT